MICLQFGPRHMLHVLCIGHNTSLHHSKVVFALGNVDACSAQYVKYIDRCIFAGDACEGDVEIDPHCRHSARGCIHNDVCFRVHFEEEEELRHEEVDHQYE